MTMKRNEPTMENTGLWEMDEPEAAAVDDNNDDRELLTKETASGSQSSNCSQTESSSSTSHQTSTANSPSRDNTNNNSINDTTTTTTSRSTSSSFSSFAMRSSLQEMSAVLGEGELPARTSFASHASRRLSSQQSTHSNSMESLHSQHDNNHPNNNNDHSTNSHSHSMSTSIMSISLRQLRSRKGSFGSSTSIVLTESQLFGNDADTTMSLDHMHLPQSPKRRSRKWNQQESMHKSRNAEQESTNALWNESQLSLMQSVSILDVVDQHVQPASSITTASSKNKNKTSTQPTSPKDSDTVSSSSAPLQLQSCLKKPTTATTATKKHARFAVNPETDRAWTLIRTFAPDHHPGLWWSMDDRQLREEEDEDMADEFEVLYGDILESAYEAAMELQDGTQSTNNNNTPSYDDLTLDSQLTQDNLAKCMDARGLEAACYSIEEYVQEAREAILEETDQQRYEQARNVSLEYSFPLQLVMHRLAVLEHALLVAAENSTLEEEETATAPSSASSAPQNNASLESGQSKILARLQEEEDDSEASDSVASLTLESAALDAEMGISSCSAHSHATNGPSSQHPESRLSVLAEVANESHTSGGMTDFHGESSSNDSKSVVVTQEALVEAEESKNDDMDQRKITPATSQRQHLESNTSIDLTTAIFGEEKSESALPSKSKGSSSSSSQVLAPKPGNSSASLSMYFT